LKECPEYRVRLFLSVDLVGSTAYKSSFLGNNQKHQDPNHGWVTRFRRFYQQFPDALTSAYRNTDSGRLADGDAGDPPPRVWKTIGDEILFCCRVNSIQHLACCVTAFLRALETFGQSLDTDNVPLDVKGAGWLAAFPAENISIEVFNGSVTATRPDEDYLTENFERDADEAPHKFDFLGTGLDAGFRIAKNAAADRFTASVGLAYSLSRAAQENMFSAQFSYHGRERLKGVNKDKPYPVVSIEAERNPQKRRLRARERLLTNETYVSPFALYDYLHDFMLHEEIDPPTLPDISAAARPTPPTSYSDFQAAWDVNVKEAGVRDESFEESEEPKNQQGSEISKEVLQFADQSFSPMTRNWLIRPTKKRRRKRHPTPTDDEVR
jgi:hypothetical protein